MCLKQRWYKDMHALEENAEEVVERDEKRVGPLAGEIRRESGILLRRWDEGQNEPIPPLHLPLQLRRLLLEKLLSLLLVLRLRRRTEYIRRK